MQDVVEAQVPPRDALKLSKLHRNLNYVKSENPPTIPRVAETAVNNEGSLVIFGGAGGKFMLQEARRGAVGTIPFDPGLWRPSETTRLIGFTRHVTPRYGHPDIARRCGEARHHHCGLGAPTGRCVDTGCIDTGYDEQGPASGR